MQYTKKQILDAITIFEMLQFAGIDINNPNYGLESHFEVRGDNQLFVNLSYQVEGLNVVYYDNEPLKATDLKIVRPIYTQEVQRHINFVLDWVKMKLSEMQITDDNFVQLHGFASCYINPTTGYIQRSLAIRWAYPYFDEVVKDHADHIIAYLKRKSK